MSENQNLPAPGARALPESAPATFLPARELAGPDDAAAASGGVRRYIAALLRYKWLILLVAGVGSCAGYVAVRFLPLEYVAEARLWIDAPDRNNTAMGPIQSAELLQQNAWVELMRSYTVLDYVVAQERLYLDYHPRDARAMRSFKVDSLYRPGPYSLRVSSDGRSAELRTRSGILVERFSPGDAVGKQAGFDWQPSAQELQPGRQLDFDVLVFRDASKRMADNLAIGLAGAGSFMTVAYRGADAERVATVVNATAARFVEVATELKRASLVQLRDILKSQLDYAETNLAANEQALESFRVETITLPTDASTPVTPGIDATQQTVLSSYFSLKVQREMLQSDRKAIQRALSGSESAGLSVDALSAIAAVQQAPELSQSINLLATKRAALRTLTQTYTAEHSLVRLAAAEIDNLEKQVIPQLAQRVISDLDTRTAVLDDLTASASGELREIPTRASDEARLSRMMTIADNLYNDLRRRYENARLAAEATVPDVKILDNASQPRRPAGDNRIRLLLMAVAGSFGAAVAVALLLDRIDPRLRYPEQITYGMRLGILGAVPHLSRKKRGLFAGDGAMPVIEALRSVRLGIASAYGSAGPVVLTISSPGSGDGKTFITSNIGYTFAEVGNRTLIIDADLRRGEAHHLFGFDRKPGLSDYLAGNCSVEETVRRTGNDRLDMVPCGTRLSNAPELLASPRMGSFLAQMKARYDVILFDSPPLGAGVDPLVLATLSGSIVLVMRNGKTDRALAESKLELLDRLPVRLLGAILNDLDSGGVYRYYSYLPGYEATSEDDAPKTLQPA